MMPMAAQSSASSAWGPKPNYWNARRAAPSHDRTAAVPGDWLWDIEWSSFAPRWGPKHTRLYRLNTDTATEWAHSAGEQGSWKSRWQPSRWSSRWSNSKWGSSRWRNDAPRWSAGGSQSWNPNLPTPWSGRWQAPIAHGFVAGWELREPQCLTVMQNSCLLRSRSVSCDRRLVLSSHPRSLSNDRSAVQSRNSRSASCDGRGLSAPMRFDGHRQVALVLQKPSPAQENIETRDIGGMTKFPSVGSSGHEDGLCKRCAFFPKGRCKNGEECTHCHLDHPKPPRSRSRARSRSLLRLQREQSIQVQSVYGRDLFQTGHKATMSTEAGFTSGDGDDAEFGVDSEANDSKSEVDERGNNFVSLVDDVCANEDKIISYVARPSEENQSSIHSYGDAYYRAHVLPDVGREFWQYLHDQCEKRSGGDAEFLDTAPTKVMETICKREEHLDEVSTQAGTAIVVPSAEEDSEDDTMHSVPLGTEHHLAGEQDLLCGDDDDSDAIESLASGDAGSDSAAEDDADTDEDEGHREHAEQQDSDVIPGKCVSERAAPKKEDEKPIETLQCLGASAGSWAAKQRMRMMERERTGTVTKEQPEDDHMSVPVSAGEQKSLASDEMHADRTSCGERGALVKPQQAKGFQISESSWAAQQRLRRAERESGTGSSSTLTAEEMGRKAKGLLNKLTEERFESLCQQVLDLPLQTPEQLQALVAEVFDKATTERGFLSLYTELCARLDAHLVAQGSSVGGKVFRKALVTECQASFERNISQPLDLSKLTHLSYEERYEEEVKHKTRTLGNMRFIGELLVRKLLAGKILFFIVNEMLDVNNEAAMESLTELLAIVAPALEQKGTIYEAPLREVFGTLKMKCKDSKISKRMRCKICDLLDLRSRGWLGKSAAAGVSPTKPALDKPPKTPKVAAEAAATRRR